MLEGSEAITCRPADQIEPEMATLIESVKLEAKEKNIELAENVVDDVLTVALFTQVGWKFLENRNNPEAFEPTPGSTTQQSMNQQATEKKTMTAPQSSGVYTITVNNQSYVVKVDEGGDITQVQTPTATQSAPIPVATDAEPMTAPLAGNIWKIHTKPGQQVEEGDVLLILEAMKMETEIKAPRAGVISSIDVNEGDAVQVGESLLLLA